MDYLHDESLIARRSFISRTMAVGMVAGIGSFSPMVALGASAAMEDVECKPSLADSLLLYLDLLIKVQSDAFTEASKGIITASTNCYETLKKIQDQVKVLQTEIQNGHTQTQTQQLRQITEIGKAQAELVKVSFNSGPSGQLALTSALTMISDHMRSTSQDLLPPGDITLTAKAKEALAELFRLVRDFGQVSEETRRAQVEYQHRLDAIRTNISAIRDALFAASAKVSEAEAAVAPNAAQAARDSAASSIDEAICILEVVRSSPGTVAQCNPLPPSATTSAFQPSAATPTDLMIAVLQGTKRMIQNPQLLSLIIGGADNRTGFVPAVFNSAATPAASIYSRVRAAINNTCPQGTWLRTLWCIDLILGPLAFPKNTRIPLIAGVLVIFPCWTGSKSDLASRLADI